MVRGRLIFGLPKGGKVRDVPLPDEVAVALSERIRLHPPVDVTLPWGRVDGEPVTRRLVFATREGGPLARRYFNRFVWQHRT